MNSNNDLLIAAVTLMVGLVVLFITNDPQVATLSAVFTWFVAYLLWAVVPTFKQDKRK